MLKSIYYYTSDGEPVLNWKGVLIAILSYPLYTVVFGSFVVYPLFVEVYSQRNGGIDSMENLYAWISSNAAAMNFWVYAISTVFLLVFFGRYLWATVRHAKEHFTPMIFWAIPVGFVGMSIISVIVQSIMTKNGLLQQSENQEALVRISGQNVPIFLFTVIVIGPFVEEVFFRAAWFRPLWKKGWVAAVAAVVLNAVLFGLHHTWSSALLGSALNLSELWLSLLYVPHALSIVYCYAVSKNFTSALLMHMAINLIASIFMFATKSPFFLWMIA